MAILARKERVVSLKMIMIVAIVLTLLVEGSSGFSLCNVSEDALEKCRPAVTKPNPTDPSAACCEDLKGADFKCLCSYKNSPLLSTVGIDPELAMELPSKCNLPPVPANC